MAGGESRSLGVPVAVNVGAAIDFAANRVRRAPQWMQKNSLEWAFRLALSQDASLPDTPATLGLSPA